MTRYTLDIVWTDANAREYHYRLHERGDCARRATYSALRRFLAGPGRDLRTLIDLSVEEA